MRKMDHDGLKLCKFQAELFQNSIEEAECSSKVFIRRFMHSYFVRRMDGSGFLYETTSISDAFDEIENQYGSSDYGQEKFSREELYWMGYIYRYWSYITGSSSKQIYRIVKPEELKKMYYPYHSLDPEQVIDRIKEAKGIVPCHDIQRGVEVLRKIRERRKQKEDVEKE